MPVKPRFGPMLAAPALGALALLVAMLVLVHPASAESDATPCATGGAVEDAANNPGLVSDCDALLEARDTLAGSGSLNWSTGTSIGQWVGVTVIGSPLRVTKLTLGRKGLAGEIPAELGNLTNLQWLDLSGNKLSGAIPGELGSLANLQWLYLAGNQLGGEIPGELGSLSNLLELDLQNDWSGGIPLVSDLSGYRLSGEIPPELGSLTNLKRLDLSGNELSGEIPPELGSLSNLQSLDLSFNWLSGEIPPELGSLSNLWELDLQNDWSSGILFLGSGPSGHRLSGEIPPELGSLTNLKRLDLSGNELSGEISAELGGLSNLTALHLQRNRLSGGIPEELGSLTTLQSLGLSGNQLSGGIPEELGSLTNLKRLDLFYNQLSGGIPEELGSLTNLKRLDLFYNQLSGRIPAELGSLTNLQWLNLAGNQLSGGIPAELGSLTNLQSLGLAGNQLSGGIPAELGSLTNLQSLGLAGNQLSGGIPAELGSLTNLQWLYLAGNQLSGGIPAELGSLANLQWLNLSGNQLSGGIPAELGSLTNLQSLNLAGNQLSGGIPAELGSLTNLKRLDLAGNQLSGEIPAELGSLTNLQWLYLAGNELSGCIPEGLLGIRASDLSALGLPFCASRFVKEGAAAGSNVGDPVVATKDYGGDPFIEFGVLLPGPPTYTLGGADAELFDIDSSTGQITVGAGTQLDYETKNRYEVTVRATSFYDSDTMIIVTIMVTDVRTGEIPPCTPIQGSSVDPCEPDVAQVSSNGGIVNIGPQPWSVRHLLDGGRGSLLEGHLVVRGTYIPGTVRCIADNTARYPSYIGVPNKSVSEGVSAFKCYADVRVNAYVVGSGPSTLTVLVRAFRYYWSDATPEAIERLRSNYERFFIEGGDAYGITVPADGIGGWEVMLYLGPAIDVSIESWRVYTTSDVQRREDGTIVVVHPDRDAWRTLSPTDYQTYRSALEMELPAFTQAVTAAHQARLTEYGGRTGPDENFPMLVNDADQLRQYYNEVGAYSYPEGPPSQPPPVYAPAPASLTATASGEATELGDESADLSWSSVAGASGYHAQHRISGAGERWFTVDESVTGTTHTASGLWCGRTHEFRVGAHGDGTAYNERAGLWSPTATATTAACRPLPPRFRADSYSFDVSAAAPVGDAVGTVSAFDLNDDTVTYSITAGNEDGKFSIGASTGEITVAASLRSAGGTRTLTVGAGDGVSGTTSVTVTILTCSAGIAVADAANNPGLVSDCETLLGARDELTGAVTLDWSANSAMMAWEGVTIGGTPKRVTHVDLDNLGLTGSIPPGLSGLAKLEQLNLSFNRLTGGLPRELGNLTNLTRLSLNRNMLTGEIPSELSSLSRLNGLTLSWNGLSGEIPPELGSLSNLLELDLRRNELTGEIPAELGSLTNLQSLNLSDNQLSGEIPSELGRLANLRRLYLFYNRLSGCIPKELRDVASNDLDLPFCASRSIREGAAAGSNVGNPVVSTDDGEGDTLTYTLGGADVDSFNIDSSTGQITVGVGTQLDYEMKDKYDVTVTATDPSSGASDTITVAIMVTDVRVSEDAAVNAYDANTNEMIDKSEVIDAILDYLNYEIEKGLVLELIGLYFGPTLTPAVALVLDSEATVTGYWSDGSANVKVTVSLRNEGNLQLSSPVQVAVTCSQDGETVDDCGGVMRVALPDGFSPGSGALTLRVPPGDLSLTFTYGEDESTVLEIDVPERIAGVDRDVWSCFRDTSNVGTSYRNLEGIGCAGWYSETVQKHDQASPVKVWASGPESFIGVFKNVLDDLGPVLGLEFEWVSTEAEAEFVADIGYTLEEGAYYVSPIEAAWATIGGANELGELERSRINIKDTWEGVAFHELPEPTQNFLVHLITHESIHTLSSMSHRTEPDSIMNINSLRRLELSPMDERLLRLHGHPLVKPGMAMPEIEALIVFNDELIDPQFDADLTKWKLASNAYRVLRQAESATFKVRSSLPDCNEEFGWADYAVFDLESHSFAWVGIDDGSDRFYVYGGRHSADEYWRRAQGGWSQVSLQRYVDATPGWNGELSDPHSMIENVLRYADWADARLVTGPDGLARLEFELGAVRGGRLEVVIVLDPETGVIPEYSMDWEWGDRACGRYGVEAEDGQYHSTFEFPDALRRESDALDDCDIEQLGPIPGVVSLSGTFRRHCGSGTDGYLRSYGFSVADWSYVRVEVSSANSTSLHLLEGSGSGELTVDQSVHITRSTREEWIWDHWAQAIVPPGQYIVEVVTHDRVLDEFGLAIHTSETHQPPHSFESISSGHTHVCALDSDWIAMCWGSNGELSAGPPHGEVSILAPSGERFIAVSSGAFCSCGLKPDGTPVCWGRDSHGRTTPPAGEKFVSVSSGGQHTCALRWDGTAACWGWNSEGQASPPLNERFSSISSGGRHTCALRSDGTPVCWGSNSEGQASPPLNERFSSISSGGRHTCALRSDGTPVCWGSNNAGESRRTPTSERFAAISSGFRHTCALRSDGSAICWGRNTEGQASPPTSERFSSISSGGRHTCALRSDGTAACWGSNSNGEPSSLFP